VELPSYSSIYNLGHKAIADLFTKEVIVEEKVDGSQFAFGVLNGEIKIRSKRQNMIVDYPEKMFQLGALTAKTLAPFLKPNWIYYGEFLSKPKHNSLKYSRVPNANIIIFDIVRGGGTEDYLQYDEKLRESHDIGLECVPLLDCGHITGPDSIRHLLEKESVLGGSKIEGVVVKPSHYDCFGVDKRVLMGKYVSEAFKETHKVEWKQNDDIFVSLIKALKTDARWEKAIQHLRDAGTLEDSPRDIGPLMKEIAEDIEREESDMIRDTLFKWAFPRIKRAVVSQFPEWYKQRLLDKQFDETR
jgi:hypothetical protein